MTKLLHLSPEEQTSILDVLESLTPSPLSIKRFADSLSREASLAQADATAIVNLATGLHSLPFFGYVTAEKLVPELLSVIETESTFKSTPEERVNLEAFLTRLMSLNNIKLVSKAVILRSGYERTFCSAKIFTDLRPTFDDTEIGEPLAFLAVHTLQITVHNGSKMEDIYIALDRDELRKLSEVVERARKKEEQLEKVVTNAGVEFLSVEEEC